MPHHEFRGIEINIRRQENEQMEKLFWDYKKDLEKIHFPKGKYALAFISLLDEIVEKFRIFVKNINYKTYAGPYDDRPRGIAMYVDTVAFFTAQLKRYMIIDDKETFKDFLDTSYTNLLTYRYTDFVQVLYHADMMVPWSTVHIIRQNFENLIWRIKNEKNLTVISGKIGGDSPFNTTGFYI